MYIQIFDNSRPQRCKYLFYVLFPYHMESMTTFIIQFKHFVLIWIKTYCQEGISFEIRILRNTFLRIHIFEYLIPLSCNCFSQNQINGLDQKYYISQIGQSWCLNKCLNILWSMSKMGDPILHLILEIRMNIKLSNVWPLGKPYSRCSLWLLLVYYIWVKIHFMLWDSSSKTNFRELSEKPVFNIINVHLL